MRYIRIILALFALLLTSQSYHDSDEIYNFSLSYIQSLGRLKLNAEKMDKITPEVYPNEFEFCTELMHEIKLQISELNFAQELNKPYLNSRDTLIKAITEMTISNYEDLKLLRRTSLKLLEEFYNSENQAVGTIMSRISDITSLEEEKMKALMYSSILLTHAIVSYEPDKYGRLSYLKITKQQRQLLIDELISIWGNEVKKGMTVGQSYLDACGGAIYEFLAGEHKSADDRIYK